MTRVPICNRRSKPRPGRLKGEALEKLRMECFRRDSFRCCKCGIAVLNMFLPHTDDRSAHMAHVKAKRIGGDSLSNVQTWCGACHRKFHNYGPSGVKPCPKKERA